MGWGHKHKVGFSLNYDERQKCWIAEFEISNRHTEKKRFKTCKEAQDYYKNHYEGKIVG